MAGSTSTAELRTAEQVTGGLSWPSKMPCASYSLPASFCRVGSRLSTIPNSVCSDCYALKGRYVFKNVQTALTRRLHAINHPDWVSSMKILIKKHSYEWFRWHDSGDLQSMDHLLKIVDVAWELPYTRFWLPTRELALVKAYVKKYGNFPRNMTVRVSGTMIDGPAPTFWPYTSTVVSEHPSCPASSTGNKCGPCRRCWDKSFANISYPKH